MLSISRQAVRDTTGPREDRSEPKWLRRVVTAVLAIHVAYSAWMVLGVFMVAGWGLGIAAESGATIAPYVFIAVHGVVTSLLFVAAFVSFIRRGRHYLLLASVAGLGGYLPLLALSWFETGLLTLSGEFRSLAYFLFPMICLSMYRLVAGRGPTV